MDMKYKNPFVDESAFEGDEGPKKSEDEVLMEEAEAALKAEQEAAEAAAAAEAEEKAAKENAPKQSYRAETKRKLSFKERKEYESLEDEIMALEEEKAAIEQEMSSGTLDNGTLVKKSMRIQEVITLIDEKSMRWLELSEFA